MSAGLYIENELKVSTAFGRQSTLFDKSYSSNTIIQYKRERVRAHVNCFLKSGSEILELNAGTGEDGIYFAKLGHRVHETDLSPEMLSVLSKKINNQNLSKKITVEECSFTTLKNLKCRGPYDLILSNFAGINCTNRVDLVLKSLPHLLKPEGVVTLVFLPPFCLWEFLMLFEGKVRTALRRFSGKKGARAHVEGVYFRCWYYSPKFIINKLKGSFELIGYEGLCTLVPPSYIEYFPEKHTRLFDILKKKEAKIKSKWPWRQIGDYVILSFRKKN